MGELPKLIVGLGNPGPEYAETRHNAGFMVVDGVLSRYGRNASREHRCDCLIHTLRCGGRRLTLAKPLCFMNQSGSAVAKMARVLELLPNEIFIVCDCLDLPLGRIRLRDGGSSGGHKGVESLIQELGTDHFPRLRVGIGRPAATAVDHVLSAWAPEEAPVVAEIVTAAVEAVLLAARRGVSVAMNAYNGWTPAEPTNDTAED